MNRKGRQLIAAILSLALLSGMMPVSMAYAAKKPHLSSTRLIVTAGRSRTLRVKNAVKTVRWKVLSGKNRIRIAKKGRAAVTVKGRKKGTAKIRAVVGTKKLFCTVVVRKMANVPKQTDTSEPTATAGPPKPTATAGQAGPPKPTATAGQAGPPEPTATAGQAGSPEPTATTGQAGPPEPTATAGQAGSPEPTATAGQAGPPKPTATAGQAGSPEPTATAGQAGPPEPTATAGQAGPPEPIATAELTVTPEPTKSPVPSIEIDIDKDDSTAEKELMLYTGETKKLSTSVSSDGYEDEVVWMSSDESVVSVAEDGTVTAVAVGMAEITAECGMMQDSCAVEVNDPALGVMDTALNLDITAANEYSNWDGVSNVTQFTDADGNYCFAYDADNYVYVVKMKDGVPDPDTVRLEKPHSIFGGMNCDADGYYYLVTGEINETEDTAVDTVFVSKYDKDGTLVDTVGDNGSSSLAYYYDTSFYTKIPFKSGNCEVTVNGNTLAVHYAREMYSGHQSNSVFAINTDTMEETAVGDIYQSHSFAQRTIPYKDGFIFAGEGDCYNRAFTVTASYADRCREADIFHFWIEAGAFDRWDMFTVNNNFAHMGGLAPVDDTNVALAGTSVKALDVQAETQAEQLFVQIFDPSKDLSTADAYVTEGTRSGMSGPGGDEEVTDHGVKWLSDHGTDTSIDHPQIVSDGNGKIAILFEKYVNRSYKGIYYILLDKTGATIQDETCLSASARLNPDRMPIYAGDKIYWTANKNGDADERVYVFTITLQG